MAAPATVSGEPCVRVKPLGNWEGWTKGGDPQARRPASAVTQPVGGAHHTERLFAAVTPMRGPREMIFTTPSLSTVPINSSACCADGVSLYRCTQASFASGPVNRVPASLRGPASEGRVRWDDMIFVLR